MTHKTTWANSDSLNVGFGPNYPERQAAGVHKSEGVERVAMLHVTYESTFGESSAYIQLPRMAKVLSADFRVDKAWASGDAGTLAVGHDEADSADIDAFITATALAAASLTPAGKVIPGDGVYLVGDNPDNEGFKVALTDSFDDATKGVKVFITKANNFTAGEGTLIVKYLDIGY